MVKKYIPKKSTKKIKKLKFVKNKPQKVEKAKRVKFKKIQQNNLYQKIPKISDKNEEINNIFLEAQSAIKILCCVCNKNITNQIKVILESTNPKNKIYQKGLNFNALCLKCFLLKTKYNSKENIYYVGNEITLYNFTPF